MLFSPCNNGNEIQGVPRYDQTLLNSAVPVLFKPLGAPKGLKSTGTAEFNKVWSYLGTPCISLPLLQGENNMPLGVQLVGARYDDHRFLGVANWLEKECNK